VGVTCLLTPTPFSPSPTLPDPVPIFAKNIKLTKGLAIDSSDKTPVFPQKTGHLPFFALTSLQTTKLPDSQ